MLDRVQNDTGLQGFGSANRSSYLVTHPTHACSEEFRQSGDEPIGEAPACRYAVGCDGGRDDQALRDVLQGDAQRDQPAQ